MTREEMIEQLENMILLIRQNGKDWLDERDIPILEEVIKTMKMEPCEDVISRQAVLELANNMVETAIIPYRPFQKAVKALPSIQPKQKEITMEDVKAYCESRNLVVISKDLFHKMINTADEIYIYLKDKEDKCKNCEYYSNPDYTRCHECKAESEEK